ncbi:YsnF/AvaK domain-containing protein (plasmid) [Rhizobium sp. TH2]|uniref:YsnF/AvaK domain-containing protein n=1 Tax=Rhizobium sp. TH2 TaxID=2775403 RepID=UPI0021582C61|nr:YsnF/AvaK domain-containing protein [Rhizobium sp. TH2]UVC12620.1 YsnF/AvaK domain-containing protein [Rhizobium sp. TH2]
MTAYNEPVTSSTLTSNAPSTLSAFFEDRDDAASAVQRLVEAGVDSANVRLVEGGDGNAQVPQSTNDKGFWASLEDFFFPDDDRAMYSEGLRRGGYLVTVSGLDASLYDTALDILDDEGTVDLDERVESWKAEGWSPETYSGASSTKDAFNSTGSLTTGRGDEEVIPVVEEELRVGKRDVTAGRVKVRAYTVETPVSESVSLRDENVTIERRPVDRALDGTETAFQDRTIEAEERHEEAVISKEARVVEEIALRKTAEQREQTVSDSVRKTEVEIEDERDLTDKRPL